MSEIILNIYKGLTNLLSLKNHIGFGGLIKASISNLEFRVEPVKTDLG